MNVLCNKLSIILINPISLSCLGHKVEKHINNKNYTLDNIFEYSLDICQNVIKSRYNVCLVYMYLIAYKKMHKRVVDTKVINLKIYLY